MAGSAGDTRDTDRSSDGDSMSGDSESGDEGGHASDDDAAGDGDTDTQGSDDPVAQTLTGYTVSGYNNATWGGSGTGDTIVVNGSGYLPMTGSDCPKDPDMQVAEAYKDKIFNGCLDECADDSNNWGHGLATVFDWSHAGGWTVAQLYSNLHHTGMWPPEDGDEPVTLVFWILGATGGEQNKLKVAIHSSPDVTSTSLSLPITVTTSWQRVVIPFASFASTGTADGLTFSATGSGAALFAIDQAYLSRTVPVP